MSNRPIPPTLAAMAITTYAWDFFGPRSEGIAQHFLRHLEEFWRTAGVEGCHAGIESLRPGHHAVWCKAPPAAHAALLTLRPHRSAADPADPVSV